MKPIKITANLLGPLYISDDSLDMYAALVSLYVVI